MEINKFFLLATLCVFSCFGREFPHYAGSCFRFVRAPNIKFPVYLRPPLHELLQNLDVKLKISVGSEPNIQTLYESSDPIERIPSPCHEELFQIEIPAVQTANKNDRNVRLKLSWPERQDEIDSVIALAPRDFEVGVVELHGLSGKFMMPVLFVKSKKEIIAKSNKERQTVASLNKKMTHPTPVLTQYELRIYHHELLVTNMIFYLTTTAYLRNVYYLVVETFGIKNLEFTEQEHTFISEVTETVVKEAKKPSAKVKIYVDTDVKAVSFKWIGDDGNVANQILYVKNWNKFELNTAKSIYPWDIFDIKSRKLTTEIIRECGEFCLYSVTGLEKKCTWGQKEITVTQFGKLGLTLYERSKVVSTVKNPWTVRVLRPAYEEEIQECKTVN